MEQIGINVPYLILQLTGILLAGIWLWLVITSLIKLGKVDMPPLPRFLWVALIICIPFLGSLAYYLVIDQAELHTSDN